MSYLRKIDIDNILSLLAKLHIILIVIVIHMPNYEQRALKLCCID